MRRTGRPRVASARDVALETLRRVRETDAYANLVLPTAIRRARLSGRDAALATELAAGTLRMRGAVDWALEAVVDRRMEDVDPATLDVLRLGAYQLLFTRVAVHAAVGETVELSPHHSRGFANAVLRRLASRRGGFAWPDRSDDLETYLCVRESHPRWLVRLWLQELGPEHTEALCRANNEFPGVGIRVDTARVPVDELARRFREAGMAVEAGRFAPQALRVGGGGAPEQWPGFEEGLFAVQDESSLLAATTLGAGPGDRIADLCAGPGGKTVQLAATGALVAAVEPHLHRAVLVASAATRSGGRAVAVRGDGTRPPLREDLDAVLVDAPCSGLGVLRRRPEARWRTLPADVDSAAALQLRLLRSGFGLLRPGGTLVYAVCTVTRTETHDVLRAFTVGEPRARSVPVHPEIPRATDEGDVLQLLPHVHGTDAMFVAAFERD